MLNTLELEQILETTVVELNQFLQAEKIQIDRIDEDNRLTLLFETKLTEQTSRWIELNVHCHHSGRAFAGLARL